MTVDRDALTDTIRAAAEEYLDSLDDIEDTDTDDLANAVVTALSRAGHVTVTD